MLLNVSNHPSEKWPTEQIEAAKKEFGEPIIDIPFPEVPPEADASVVFNLADDVERKAAECIKQNPYKTIAIMVMGEYSLFYELVNCFKAMKFVLLLPSLKIVVATTKRDVVEENGVKKSIFKFVRFREIK